MAVLIGMSGDLKGETFKLDSDTLILGRADDCAIVINNPTVSGHHCQLVPAENGGYLVRDLGSTNGTRVNAREAKNTPLCAKDIVQVGSVEFLYDGESATSGPTGTCIETNIEESIGQVKAPSAFGNISPFSQSRKDNRKLWFGIIAVVGILALAVAVFVVLKLAGFIA